MESVNFNDRYANLNELNSNADCTLYTYGVGGSSEQAVPPYMLELAKDNLLKKYEMVHCDPYIFYDENKTLIAHPPCLNKRDWGWKKTEGCISLFQHKIFSNLKTKLISKYFPTDKSFGSKFQKYLSSNLKKGKEIFLGVHNACWTDMQCCLGDTYNKLREKFKNRIHFYIQASDIPAFVYKGAYLPLMGLFARTIYWNNDKQWMAFQRVFSQANPTTGDIKLVRQAFGQFLAVRSNPKLDEKMAWFMNPTTDDEHSALQTPDQKLYDYLDNPLQNRLVVVPMEKLNAQILKSEPGEEKVPSFRPHRNNEFCTQAAPFLVLAVGVAALILKSWYSK